MLLMGQAGSNMEWFASRKECAQRCLIGITPGGAHCRMRQLSGRMLPLYGQWGFPKQHRSRSQGDACQPVDLLKQQPLLAASAIPEPPASSSSESASYCFNLQPTALAQAQKCELGILADQRSDCKFHTWSLFSTSASSALTRSCRSSMEEPAGCVCSGTERAMRACCSESTSSLTRALRRAASDLRTEPHPITVDSGDTHAV